ncbi:MAG: polysaccharide biosynthesis/export family protein [Candidatus Deferrimicrobiaceae bacterium]
MRAAAPPVVSRRASPPTLPERKKENAVPQREIARSARQSAVPQNEQPAATENIGGPNYRIGPEDVLHIDVWDNEELTGDVTVRPDGKISMPLIQDIQAEGRTSAELADRIRDKLLSYIKNPNVSVIVREINAPKISIIGYVAKPGTYPLRGDLNVLQALSQAGGFTPFASPKKIKVIRYVSGNQEVRLINYYHLIEEGGEGHYLLKPGDTIVVP